MPLKFDALRQSIRHAAYKRGALFNRNGFIFFSDDALELFSRSRVAMINTPFQYVPEILYWVEVRRAWRKFDDMNAMVMHPYVCSFVDVRRRVVLKKSPDSPGEKTAMGWLQVVLKNIAVELFV